MNDGSLLRAAGFESTFLRRRLRFATPSGTLFSPNFTSMPAHRPSRSSRGRRSSASAQYARETSSERGGIPSEHYRHRHANRRRSVPRSCATQARARAVAINVEGRTLRREEHSSRLPRSRNSWWIAGWHTGARTSRGTPTGSSTARCATTSPRWARPSAYRRR